MKSILALLFAYLLAGFAHAVPTTAITVSGGSISTNSFVWGYTFSISQAFKISGLGVWDQDQDGLPGQNRVAIWDSLGAIVMDATVQGGASEALADGFRFTSAITGTTVLNPGVYTIGTQRVTGSITALLGGTVSTISGVTFLQSFNNGSSSVFSQPTNLFGLSMIGPSFRVDDLGVPELGVAGTPLAAAILACLTLMCGRRGRSRYV